MQIMAAKGCHLQYVCTYCQFVTCANFELSSNAEPYNEKSWDFYITIWGTCTSYYVLSSETCPQITWRATRNFFQFLQWFIIKEKAIDIEIAFNNIILSHAAIFCVSLVKKLKKNLIQKRQKNNLWTFFKRNMLCYTREWEKKGDWTMSNFAPHCVSQWFTFNRLRHYLTS